jgi:hypothetical protein
MGADRGPIVTVAPPLQSEEDVQRIYNWIDEIPLSRPKRSISRDFADGLLAAEVCHYFFPGKVDLHNYSAANSLDQKRYNWNTINVKVLKKLGYMVHPSDIERTVKAEPGAVERVLAQLMTFLQEKARDISVNEALGEKSRPVSPPQRQHDIRVNDGAQREPEKAGQGRNNERDAARMLSEVDTEILVEKEHTIHELRETVMIMSEKIRKLEQLVRIKDTKIESLNSKIDRLERGLA